MLGSFYPRQGAQNAAEEISIHWTQEVAREAALDLAETYSEGVIVHDKRQATESVDRWILEGGKFHPIGIKAAKETTPDLGDFICADKWP